MPDNIIKDHGFEHYVCLRRWWISSIYWKLNFILERLECPWVVHYIMGSRNKEIWHKASRPLIWMNNFHNYIVHYRKLNPWSNINISEMAIKIGDPKEMSSGSSI